MHAKSVVLCSLVLACLCLCAVLPVQAFTANSLDITIQENGDGLATFRFTLEGFIENAIPQSVLEEELTKGLTTSSDPPELRSMDRSTAVLLMKKFADTSDVPRGTEYRTASMDFKKAEIALENSALSGAVTADFSPSTVTLTFPDNYRKQFSNVDVLPSVTHVIEDPVKIARLLAAEAEARAQEEARAAAQAGATPAPTEAPAPGPEAGAPGSINVSSTPGNVKVTIDSRSVGEAPGLFTGIAAGTHVMGFSREGYATVSKSVLVNPGKTTNVMVVLTQVSTPAVAVQDDTSSSWIPVLVVILGIVILGAGAYMYWMENEKKNRTGRKTQNGSPPAAGAKTPVAAGSPVGRTAVPQARKPETLKFIDVAAPEAVTAAPAAADAATAEPSAESDSTPPAESPAEAPANGSKKAKVKEIVAEPAETVPEPAPCEDDTGDECR